MKKDGAGGSVSYTYNALNLLSQWTDGTHTENYSYNASGLLSSVTTESSTTELVWDILNGDGQVLTATTAGETTAYTYGLERISAITGKTRTEYVYDARGSVAAEITNSGMFAETTATSKTYTPFGEQSGEVTSGFGYNGEYYNAETKQVYLRARFYEPEMNRFSQKDIIRGSVADGLSLNRYLYCANDPVNYIDPSGMTFKSAVQKTASSVWNSVKSAAQSFVSDPIGTAAKAVTTVVKAAANPIGTAVNIAKSAVSAAKDFYQEAIKPAAGTTADNNGHSHRSGKFGTDGGTGIGYGSNYPSVTEDGTDLTDPSVQQSAAQDLPYIWYNEEEHAYYCGSEKISYDNDNYKKAVDYTWLEAQRKGENKFVNEVIVPSLEGYIGVGGGYGGSFTIFELLGITVQAAQNVIELRLDDGELYWAQSWSAEASFDLVTFTAGIKEEGAQDLDWNEIPGTSFSGTFSDFVIPTGVDVSLYVLYGGSAGIKLNAEEFFENYQKYKEEQDNDEE